MKQLALMTRFDCNVCQRYCPSHDRVALYQETRHCKDRGWERACVGYAHEVCCNWRGTNP